MTTTIGVLAIQGAVEEHVVCMQKLGCVTKEIRVPADMEGVEGIILPGGESTAMAIVGERCGLFPELKKWVEAGKPIWGTCAGMILLSDHAIKQARLGQSLVGGLDVHVCRNYFGSQMNSCQVDVNIESPFFAQNESDGGGLVNAVFIRAPAILKCGPKVKVLGSLVAKPHVSALKEVVDLLQAELDDCVLSNGKRPAPSDAEKDGWIAKRQRSDSIGQSSSAEGQAPSHSFTVAVAVQQENILACAFHPELTGDNRWHRYFLQMVESYKKR
ncbi:SNO glutamine amidotransferase family-domain-containing protein [Ochromonadaceae sp. CCMP2298]|nr:SNO glutamine amidotransferase family-domain-containing protein [Ochromonadaceae sp. CCMP2298]|mmetsp:Transcript_5361/g.11830  ORF Transcript_5361/g.11830 Transcript_5361/m.11830 type:complete len:272 (-) Transcript_5361:128-943(-)|eukprot:CAMPEP_0173190288 /NCGR_PEP_ID=MMETSP1141-20130122/12264_1 /TAXON_ID=483371 /ORGANISM="non described non described, Strain CCMP2298" /LENGTH=271 /DNA_ID=CAMNT_0014114385 /DNA_START=41 /DNA_END=856 /DNA_ORIENTATION=-